MNFRSFAIISTLVFLCGCDIFENPDSSNSYTTIYKVAGGATMILDANDFSGNGVIPVSACAATTWADKSGNSNNGTLTCGTRGFGGAGVPSNPYAVAFDGVTTSVTTPLNTQAAAMPSTSWMAWVNPASTSLQHIASIDNHGGAFNRALVINGGSFEAFTGTGTNFTSTTINQSQWQQIVVVYTPTDIVIYKNGAVFARGIAPTIQATAQTFTIGRNAGGAFDFFSGSINWIGVYNRALTPIEVSVSCRAMQGRFDSLVCAN